MLETIGYANRFGERALADRAVQHAVITWPRDAQVRSVAAALALEAHDSAGAREHIRRGLAADPGHALLRRMDQAVGRQP